MEERFFTARAFEEGQPDKVADILADTILDEYLKEDPETKADIKVVITKSSVNVYGELTSSVEINLDRVVRDTLKEIGYEDQNSGIDPYKCEINKFLQKQSQDIARSLHPKDGDDIPASDLGVVYGFASDEEINYLPKALNLANSLAKRLTFVRKSEVIEGLLPDGQVSVIMEYLHDVPQRISTIILSAHHKANVDIDWLRVELTEKVVNNICKKEIDDNTKLLINSGGRFVLGGPAADIGMSGRNIENETYGGFARYGGLSFAGRDPKKVNRTTALIARQAAVNVVNKRLASKVEVYVGYAFGVVNPVCIDVETFGTAVCDEREIIDYVNMNFDFSLTPAIMAYELQKPIYKDLALNGYWGRHGFLWEKPLL